MTINRILKLDVTTALTELGNCLRGAVDTSIVPIKAINSQISKSPKGLKVLNVSPTLFDLETLDALVSVAFPDKDYSVIFFDAEEPDKYSKGSPASLFIGSANYKDDSHTDNILSSM